MGALSKSALCLSASYPYLENDAFYRKPRAGSYNSNTSASVRGCVATRSGRNVLEAEKLRSLICRKRIGLYDE